MNSIAPRSPSLREHALETIRLAITAGELDEGRIYSAAALAKQLGVSLSPVREAMMALVSEGTVEAIPNRGFRLTPVTPQDLDEIIRIRILLSLPAVEYLSGYFRERNENPASPRSEAIERDVQRLRFLAQEAVSAADSGDGTKFSHLDREFHRSLIEFGVGRRAAEICLQLRDQSRVTVVAGDISKTYPQAARNLVDLVNTITEGDTAQACSLFESNLTMYKTLTG